MVFRTSVIAISAAVILAFASECHKTASLFFAIGLAERMAEQRQQERKAEEEEEEED